MFKDWSEEVPTTYDAQPWPGLADLTERELAVYRVLWACTKPGTDMAHVRHRVIADRVGLKSDRQVRTLMARLYDRGLVVPSRRKIPNPDGGWRWGASYYRLLVPLHALPPSTVRKWPSRPSPQVAPLGSGRPLPSKNVSTEVSLEGEGECGATTGDPVINPAGRQLFDVEELERDPGRCGHDDRPRANPRAAQPVRRAPAPASAGQADPADQTPGPPPARTGSGHGSRNQARSRRAAMLSLRADLRVRDFFRGASVPWSLPASWMLSDRRRRVTRVPPEGGHGGV